ncbi:MAG TPA: class I SAM-dependent methyltransferase [Candidatus Limnocylindria bacterium]|nr:class I SAM-dependent methyltransferase [Candidatus Limnocylindria bacterium]
MDNASQRRATGSYATRYTPEAAKRYQRRKAGKHEAEMALVRRAFAEIPKGTVLDVPCGGGRVAMQLAQLGYTATAADLSPGMRDIAQQAFTRSGLSIKADIEDVGQLSYPDRHFDAVISFRLFHHFGRPETRRQAVVQLCRVARTHVAISYFSPWSFTAFKRFLQRRFLGKITKFHTPLSEVAGYFHEAGFALVRDHAQLRGIKTLHVAVFRRREGQS